MRKRTLIFPVAFFISSFFILYFSSGAVQSIRDNLYNSDILFPFSLYRGIFQAGSHPDWIFGSNTPYLELFFGLILWLIARGNIHLTLVFYAVFQPVFMVVCLLYLARCLLGKNWLLFSLVLIFSALPVIAFSMGVSRPLFFLFTWFVHMITMGLALVALGLVIQVINTDQVFSERVRIRLYLLCLLTVLATTSDALFIFQLTAPVIAVLALMVILSIIPLKKAGVITLSLIFGTGLGQVLYKLPLLLGANRVSLVGSFMSPNQAPLIDQLQLIAMKISNAWDGALLGWVIWSGFYLLCLLLALTFIWRWHRNERGKIRSRFFVILLFFPLQLTSNIASSLISGNFELRYFMPLVYIPLFLGWPFLFMLIPWVVESLRGKRVLAVGLSLLGLAAVLWVVNLNSSREQHPNLADYYPGLVACVDDHSRELGLHRGIAQYWYARYISILSKDNLMMVQEIHSMAPFFYLNNSDGYEDDFDFVLAYSDAISMNRVDPANLVDRAAVIARFGEPAVSFNCDGVDMLVYNRENDQTFKRQFRLYMGFGNWK